MIKELTNNQELGTGHPVMNKWEARMAICGLAAGMATGSMISPEVLKSLDEAAKVLNINKEEDKDQKPPKPPRNPNARTRMGGLALGNT